MILHAIDESLQLMGDEPPEMEPELRIYTELRKARETLIRTQRDSVEKTTKRPDSRSPLGI